MHLVTYKHVQVVLIGLSNQCQQRVIQGGTAPSEPCMEAPAVVPLPAPFIKHNMDMIYLTTRRTKWSQPNYLLLISLDNFSRTLGYIYI